MVVPSLRASGEHIPIVRALRAQGHGHPSPASSPISSPPPLTDDSAGRVWVCPSLRAWREHILIVRPLRAHRVFFLSSLSPDRRPSGGGSLCPHCAHRASTFLSCAPCEHRARHPSPASSSSPAPSPIPG